MKLLKMIVIMKSANSLIHKKDITTNFFFTLVNNFCKFTNKKKMKVIYLI